MRSMTLLTLTITTLLLTGACARPTLVADAGDAVRQTAMDAPVTTPANAPFLAGDVQRGAVEVAALYTKQSGCPAVRVRRADALVRGDGSPWMVVRLNACGEERIYEKTRLTGWHDATSRLR